MLLKGEGVWHATYKAGGRGFEPRHTDPESAVLPLDESPANRGGIIPCLCYNPAIHSAEKRIRTRKTPKKTETQQEEQKENPPSSDFFRAFRVRSTECAGNRAEPGKRKR